MKIYSVVNREDAKQYLGADSCTSFENCSDLYYRYVMSINTDVQIEIEEGLKCYDKHDVFGVLYAILLRISGDLL